MAEAAEPAPTLGDAAAHAPGLGPGNSPLWRRVLAPGWILPAALSAAAFAVALLAFAVFTNSARRDPAVALPSGPIVFVAPYELIYVPVFARILRNRLQYELINSLSRFPELSVLGIDTVYGEPGGGGRTLYGADFILQGSVQAAASELRVTSPPLETGNRTVV